MGWPYDSLNITWAILGESPYQSESLPPNGRIWGFDFFFIHMVPAQLRLLVYFVIGWSLTEMSVLGSQVFEQASTESCGL